MKDQRVATLAENIFRELLLRREERAVQTRQLIDSAALNVFALEAFASAEHFAAVARERGYYPPEENQSPQSEPGKTWNYPGHASGCNCFVCSR